MIDPKRIIKAAAVFAGCAFVVFYMYRQVIGAQKTTLETETALAITLENTVDSVGYIVRSEKVIENSHSGTVFAVVEDGEKVAGGKVVANVYTNKADAGTKARIDKINEKLEILKSSKVDQEYFSADVGKLEKDKNEILGSIVHSKANNDFTDCVGKKSQLLVSMNKLASVKSGESFDEQIAALEDELSRLTVGTGSSYSRIASPASGYYSGIADGYEKTFTPSILDSMTLADFKELSESEPDRSILSSNAGKIVTDSRWYILCELRKSDTASFETGKKYSVLFPYSSNTTVEMELYRIISETNKNNVVLVFTSNYMPSSFGYTRSQKIQIVSESYSGLKIPKSAMRMLEDGTKGVYVLIGETVHFRRAEEIYQFDDSYIIRGESDEEKSEKAAEMTPETQPETETQPDSTAQTDMQSAENNDSKDYRYLALYDNVIVSGKDLFDGKRIS